MTVKFYIAMHLFVVPEDWIETGYWKVYFYYRRWPWAHNDNEPSDWWTK